MKFLSVYSLAFILCACGNQSAATPSETAPITSSTSAPIAKALPTLTGNYVWDVNHSASTLTFEAIHNGDTFTGTISDFDAAIRLNPHAPAEGGEIHAVMGLKSLDAKDDDRNANLPTKEWFHLAMFPTAEFVSTDISLVSENQFSAEGELTIKGISKPITLLFNLKEVNNGVIAKGEANILRTDYNLGESADFKDESWVGFPVRVLVSIEARRKGDP